MLTPNSARIGSRQPRHSRICGLLQPPALLRAMPQTSFSVSRYHIAILELGCSVFSAPGTCHAYDGPVVAHHTVAPVRALLPNVHKGLSLAHPYHHAESPSPSCTALYIVRRLVLGKLA